MPLNIEVKEPTEHPDVTALKNKVREAAREHSRRNHCGEYKSWLRDLGIEDEQDTKVKVEITFTAFGVEDQKAVKAFKESDLAGKTVEEQNAWVAEQISEKVTIAGTQVAIPLTVTDLNLIAIEEAPEGHRWGTSGRGLVYPEAYVHMYTQPEGRVAHLTRLNNETLHQLQMTDDPAEQERILRNYIGRGGYRVTAMCGKANYGWGRTSSRSENRVCQNCANIANH